VESTSKHTDGITGRRESERTKARVGFPYLTALGRTAPFQSQRLRVGGRTTRWVFVVTAILDTLKMFVWSRLHAVVGP